MFKYSYTVVMYMYLLQYGKSVDSLPDAKGFLSRAVPSQAIDEANKLVANCPALYNSNCVVVMNIF